MDRSKPNADDVTPGRIATEPQSQQPDICYHCSGYYGQSNGDPLCGICHDFLYIEHFYSSPQQNWGYSSISQTQATEKDDGDSGNDEPSEDAPPVPPINPQPRISLQDASDGILSPSIGPNAETRTPLQAELNLAPHCSSFRIAHSSMAPEHIPSSSDSSPEGMYNIPIQNAVESREYERITRRLALLTSPMPAYKMAPEVDLTTRLPPEIWRMVFQKLDPVSLLLTSRVRIVWKSIILEMVPNDIWKTFVMERWPLFNPIYEVNDWYSVFLSFFQSLSCCSCWIKMSGASALLPAVGDNGNGMVFRSLRSVRLSKELKWLRSDHPDGIEAVPLDYLNYNWLARIIGPPQSPYQGGVFYLNIKIPHDYPLKPPLVRFLTKVYHPNISRHGDIGIDCIQHNWTLALFIPQTLLSIQSLLTDPCTESASMEPAISYHYENDRKGFEREARMWTWKYAMIDVLLT